jgi:predicted nucleotidyltransferase
MALSDAEINAIKELHANLTERFELSEFIIYGSKAAGTDVSGSDIDVIIVLEQISPEIESQICCLAS